MAPRVAAALSLGFFALVLGCAEPSPRSPTTDYPHPPVQTSDGEVVGADRRPPGDTLQAGPNVGTGGVKPGGTASAEVRPAPPPPDPRCKSPDPAVRATCPPAPGQPVPAPR